MDMGDNGLFIFDFDIYFYRIRAFFMKKRHETTRMFWPSHPQKRSHPWPWAPSWPAAAEPTCPLWWFKRTVLQRGSHVSIDWERLWPLWGKESAFMSQQLSGFHWFSMYPYLSISLTSAHPSTKHRATFATGPAPRCRRLKINTCLCRKQRIIHGVIPMQLWVIFHATL